MAKEVDKIEELKPTPPVAPAHFVQHRPFLRRWRLEDCLQQDLKHGIALQNNMRGAGLLQWNQWNHLQSDINAQSVNQCQSLSIFVVSIQIYLNDILILNESRNLSEFRI